MNNSLSLAPDDDLDGTMRMVARNLAMGIYEIDDILEKCDVKLVDFNRWKTSPRFLEYLKSEREAWNAAINTPERAKLKASIIMEEFMIAAHGELHEKKTPLNQRVELAKLLAKIAGMGEQKVIGGIGGGGVGGFSLQINIGQGVPSVDIRPIVAHTIEHSDVVEARYQAVPDDPVFEEDYDDMASPFIANFDADDKL